MVISLLRLELLKGINYHFIFLLACSFFNKSISEDDLWQILSELNNILLNRNFFDLNNIGEPLALYNYFHLL